jgi:hypothetical protein
MAAIKRIEVPDLYNFNGAISTVAPPSRGSPSGWSSRSSQPHLPGGEVHLVRNISTAQSLELVEKKLKLGKQ